MWQLDGGEVLSSSNADGSVVLGVLGESVVSLCDSGLVRISQPINGTQTVETRLDNCQRSVTLSKSVNLPKRGKVFFVSKEGFLYQVCVSPSVILFSLCNMYYMGAGCLENLRARRNNNSAIVTLSFYVKITYSNSLADGQSPKHPYISIVHTKYLKFHYPPKFNHLAPKKLFLNFL